MILLFCSSISPWTATLTPTVTPAANPTNIPFILDNTEVAMSLTFTKALHAFPVILLSIPLTLPTIGLILSCAFNIADHALLVTLLRTPLILLTVGLTLSFTANIIFVFIILSINFFAFCKAGDALSFTANRIGLTVLIIFCSLLNSFDTGSVAFFVLSSAFWTSFKGLLISSLSLIIASSSCLLSDIFSPPFYGYCLLEYFFVLAVVSLHMI